MRRRVVISNALVLAVLLSASAPVSADSGDSPPSLTAPGEDARRQALRERWREASPAERRRIREIALEYWVESPLEENLNAPAQRREIRRYLESLSPDERRALRKRVESYRALDQPDRRRLRRALRNFRELPPERQERFRANAQRWNAMSPGEKARLREKMTLLRGMQPEERLELLERALPEDAAAATLPAPD